MTPATTDLEAALVHRVLDAAVREDVVGLRTRGTSAAREDGPWLRLDGPDGDRVELPVEPDGFLCRWRSRRPVLVRGHDGTRLRTCHDIVTALGELADPQDRPGYSAWAQECEEALTTMRLHTDTWATTSTRLTRRHGADPATWTGLRAGVAFDALAARIDHPVYPTARARGGLSTADVRTYGPETHPAFALRLLALPRTALHGAADAVAATATRTGSGPGTGIAAERPDLADSHVLLPIHPLTVGEPLERALAERGLLHQAHLLEAPGPLVRPTLSMRSVALADDPTTHLKVPLATATLGRRNRRTIQPGTLVDGAVAHRLLGRVLDHEPALGRTVLLTDESTYAHAGHPLLACLVRRYPDSLDDSVVVPLAALLAPAPGGGLVVDALARRFFDDDPLALLDGLLRPLLHWQTVLLHHGIALESHQQNVSLVLDEADGRTRARLLLKDDDGLRVHPRAAHVVGADLLAAFDDRRIVVADDGPLVDLFTTITVHLCAGALAVGLEAAGRAAPGDALDIVRDRLADAVTALPHGTARSRLLADVLEARSLPVKAMVTAGTLLTKERSGAADINKHYTSGPNYLLRDAR